MDNENSNIPTIISSVKSVLTQTNPMLGNIDFSNAQYNMIPDSVKRAKKESEELYKKIIPYEERIKPLTDKLDNMTIELESQTTELQKLRYENTKLNAQIEVLNVTNDKQLAEISDLKANDIVSKNTIQTLNDTVSNMTSKSKLNAIIGILFAIIEGIAVWYITTKLLS